MAELLDPLSLPLRGSRLIEASAGTGKTWTIAALYLRLVLGHGDAASAPVRPLNPGDILVMTFTKAATRELSERIRSRLVTAAACFRGEEALPPGDAFLADLLASFEGPEPRQWAAWRLSTAAQAMDEAAIFTIDAWCQRMLREHAFDSGCLFDEELQADESHLLVQACQDYWRQEIYPLRGDDLAEALAVWPSPDALVAAVGRVIAMPMAAAAAEGPLSAALSNGVEARARALCALKQAWEARVPVMDAWIQQQLERSPPTLKKTKFTKSKAWLQTLLGWARDPQAVELPLTATALERFTPAGMRAEWLGAGPPCLPAAFDEFASLPGQCAGLPDPSKAMLAHASARIAARMSTLKARAGTYGFADMLSRLDSALDEAAQGERARRLRARIVAQFPAALVDEFQDTAPIQLRVFDRLYGIQENAPDRCLLLIGDPKQAIYGFRGADIHSYLKARQSTRGRHHVLGVNHRSSQPLVQAVNAIFQGAEARGTEGAFLFGGPAGESPLPFLPVQAKGRPETLQRGGEVLPPLQMGFCADLLGKEASYALLGPWCAEQIVQMLNDPRTGFEEPGKPFRRLRPGDVAVLVHNAAEARAVRAELRLRGVASVYLSDKDTVLQSEEARDVLRLLQAVAAPRDMRLVRAALATRLMGLSLAELLDLALDDAAFDVQCEKLAALHQVWLSRGVLAMVRQALHGFGLPARWLREVDGERRLTNVLHLGELLQLMSGSVDGVQALVRWLVGALQDADQGLVAVAGDELVLRLESDADLVQVITIHKSKGLEYPVVFVPFASLFRAFDRSKHPFVQVANPDGERFVVLNPTDADVASKERERLQEDLRLLYVALTRPRHHLGLGISIPKVGHSNAVRWHDSAIGALLSGTDASTLESAQTALMALADRVPGLHIMPLAAGQTLSRTGIATRAAQGALEDAPAYAARFDLQWSISSYSSLIKAASKAPQTALAGPLPRALRDDERDETESAAPSANSPAPEQAPDAQPWHQFPKGAFAGNFLHAQLEWLAGERFALPSSPALRQQLAHRCDRQGWGHRVGDVQDWMEQICATPLPALRTPLSGLGTVLPEMEFWLPGDGLDAALIDRLCCEHLFDGKPRPRLAERSLKGMLMGFADLVFEHQGRFGVMDYKSNFLGPCDAAYSVEAMTQAMLDHRYDVQAALYLLALHRLLRARLGRHYDPAVHLHGADYLFLRGIRAESAGCLHVRPPGPLIAALDAAMAVKGVA